MKTKIYFLMCGLIFNAFSAQSFDTTFGTNGKLTQPNLGDFYSATEVAGGKVIAAGYNSEGNAVILKFLENGSMDATFGTNGKVVINQYTGSGSYEEAAIPVELSNGKILVGYGYELDNGVDPYYFGTKIIRMNADGTIDATFSNPMYTEPNMLYNFVVLPLGKILAAGDNFLRRFNADGSLDTTYGTGGTRAIAFESKILQTGSMIFLWDYTNNRIVKLANEESTSPVFYTPSGILIEDFEIKNNNIYIIGSNSKIIKLDINLNPVTAYGVNGTADLSTANITTFWDFEIQPGGSILFFNMESDGTTFTRKISRVNPMGALDTTFGSAGHFSYPFTDAGYGEYDGQILLNNFNGKLYIADLQEDPGDNVILTRLNLAAEASLGITESNPVESNFAMENPVKDFIKTSNSLNNIVIYSVSGAMVKMLRNTNESVSDLKPGVYILTGKDKAGKKVSQKFIKK